MTTDSERAAFIRAICENPADDTARLVYADWLQENGNASWARFIRHQIWTPVSPCRNAPLMALLSLEPFVGPLPHAYSRNVSGVGGATVTYPNGMEFWFTRGFVSRIELPCADFLTHAAALFAAHPIESVRLTDRNPRQWPVSGDWWWAYIADNDIARHDRMTTQSEYVLPGCLRLGVQARGKSGRFSTQEEAEAAASLEAVAYGRELAGLPPLTAPSPS